MPEAISWRTVMRLSVIPIAPGDSVDVDATFLVKPVRSYSRAKRTGTHDSWTEERAGGDAVAILNGAPHAPYHRVIETPEACCLRDGLVLQGQGSSWFHAG
jgi:hypothetical protein